jgi:hypothetical protein
MAKIMGAKPYAAALMIVSIALSGCAGLKRLAPPGVIKYENLEGDQPPSPLIKERIAARRDAGTGSFPNIGATPSKKPAGVPKKVREQQTADLIAARDALNAAVAADRTSAASEREGGVLLPGDEQSGERPLDAAQEALAEAIAKDEAAARRERGLKPREPQDKPQ